jgi:hypothetical protein
MNDFIWSLKTSPNNVGAGFPRPIGSITKPGGENPPLHQPLISEPLA